MAKHGAMYACLSRTADTLQSQMRDLLDLACQRGCEIVATLSDSAGGGSSGSSTEGPDVQALANGVVRPDVGVVMGWTMDRSGRTQQHLVILPAADAARPD
jgi:hypothetical protein